MSFAILRNITVPFALIALIGLFQYSSDKTFPTYDFLSPFVLPADVLRVLDLGMDSAASSYVWLSMIQDFSANRQSRYGSIEAYISTVTSLDPQFSYPYAFATLVFPEFGLVDEGIKIGFEGITALPDDWQIPYYLGIIFHLHKKDRATASKLFDHVARMTGTPSNIKIFTQSYGSSKDVRAQSRNLWRTVLKESNDDIVRQRAQAYLTHYDVLDFMEVAAKKYKLQFGRFPERGEDLITGGILRELPPNPFDLKFVFDSSGQIISRVD